MNARFKDILERAQTWPDAAQEHAVDLLLTLEQQYVAESYELTEDDKVAIDRGLEDIRNGRVVSHEKIKELFDRYRQK